MSAANSRHESTKMISREVGKKGRFTAESQRTLRDFKIIGVLFFPFFSFKLLANITAVNFFHHEGTKMICREVGKKVRFTAEPQRTLRDFKIIGVLFFPFFSFKLLANYNYSEIFFATKARRLLAGKSGKKEDLRWNRKERGETLK